MGGEGELQATPWESVDDLRRRLREHRYLADRGLATALHLAVSLQRPLFLEGEAGVGKTEVANVVAQICGVELIRLQCHEGIDASQALYDWNYPRQLLVARTGELAADDIDNLFTWDNLIERPLLKAIRSPERSVLLLDEIDRADDEFEAFLLEILSDHSVTIPELGTITAEHPPIVILTSNRTRDVHDALKRRCYYHLIRHPDPATEAEIIRIRAPKATASLAQQVAETVAELRKLALTKPPGIAESIDWAAALTFLGVDPIDETGARDTIGALIKQEEDLEPVVAALSGILGNRD